MARTLFEEDIVFLKKNRFDIDKALEICAQDMGLYAEVLETALEEGVRKYPLIEGCIKNNDYERYHIEVHGLKNAAKAIGAMELSDIALQQEKAVKDNPNNSLDTGGKALLEKYHEVLEILRTIFEK